MFLGNNSCDIKTLKGMDGFHNSTIYMDITIGTNPKTKNIKDDETCNRGHQMMLDY